MKILSNARFISMQKAIATKSDQIKRQSVSIGLLEQENIKLSGRVAELEQLLHAYGVIDQYGEIRYNATERAKIVVDVLDRMEKEGRAQ